MIRLLFLLLFKLLVGVQDKELDALERLVGTWRMKTERGAIIESWEKFGTVELRGKSYALKGSDTVLLETISITKVGNKIFYIPVTQGQNNQQPVSFELKSAKRNKFIFENLQHDYPQRIIYDLIQQDSITARIEGTYQGKERSTTFYYRRME